MHIARDSALTVQLEWGVGTNDISELNIIV